MTGSTLPAQENRTTGIIAIAIAVAAAAISFPMGWLKGGAVLLHMLGELTAIALGMRAWHTPTGKLAMALGVVLLIAMFVWLLSPLSIQVPKPPGAP